MFGFRIRIEPRIEPTGGSGTHGSPSGEGHGSGMTSPVSVTPPEDRGLGRFPARAPSTSESTSRNAPSRAQTSTSGTSASPAHPRAQLPEFATRLKPAELASMRKERNDVYVDGDDHAYVVVKDKVYRVWQTGLEPPLAYVLDPHTHRFVQLVLERDKNHAWQVRDERGLPDSGTPLIRLYHQSEAENRTLANDVYAEVKKAYRAGLKSDNKIYVRGDKRDASLVRASDASLALAALRDRQLDNHMKGKVATPSAEPLIPAANCGDLARMVANRTTQRGGYAEVWVFDDANHAFAVIGHPPAGTTTSFSNWKDVWIVDPWANIVCPATQYVSTFVEKMKKWERAGKVIDSGTIWPLDPVWMNAAIDGAKRRFEAPGLFNRNPWRTIS